MANLDLSDLLILKEIYRTRSITRSVEHVGLSQPSISIRLARLRTHFDDILFVRTSAGMQATPRMKELIPKIEHAIELLSPDAATLQFDPASSTRIFRLGLAHVAQIAILPELTVLLDKNAPGLKLESLDLGPHTAEQLETGEVDVAIGYATDLRAGVYQQRLLTETYVCVARNNHPNLKSGFSIHEFLSEEYVSFDAPGTVHGKLDDTLKERGLERRIRIRVPSLLGIGQIILSTNLLAILPTRVALTLKRDSEISILPLPFTLPSYDVCQYWHERYHKEPGHIWFRKFIFKTFLDMPLPTPPKA